MNLAFSNNGAPLVSVILLNYRRREALEQTLDSVLRQQYANREIIIVDNGSQRSLRDLVGGRDPTIQLIELPENRGAGGGRNVGIRIARGEIVITLDDDMSFASPCEIGKVVKTFEERPDIHVLAFQVCDAETGKVRLREWCHPRSWREFGESSFETHFFVEGACACRREVYERAGLYYEPLNVYCEGYDLALRILDFGFRILYAPTIQVFHRMSPVARPPERPYYLFTRNYIWIAYKDYGFLDGIRFLMPKLSMMLYFTLRSGRFLPFLKGFWDGFARLREIRRARTPVRRATVQYMAELDKHRPGLLFRLARHRTQPQL